MGVELTVALAEQPTSGAGGVLAHGIAVSGCVLLPLVEDASDVDGVALLASNEGLGAGLVVVLAYSVGKLSWGFGGGRHLVLQRQLWRRLSSGPVVGGAGLGLASSAPPRPVRGVVEVGPWCADEGVEQPSEFGHGQRDELVGAGCGAPFSAVARVALR